MASTNKGHVEQTGPHDAAVRSLACHTQSVITQTICDCGGVNRSKQGLAPPHSCCSSSEIVHNLGWCLNSSTPTCKHMPVVGARAPAHLLFQRNRLQPQHLTASSQAYAAAASISSNRQSLRQTHVCIIVCVVYLLHLPAIKENIPCLLRDHYGCTRACCATPMWRVLLYKGAALAPQRGHTRLWPSQANPSL